jgi:DNA-binding PadR family transcriptional regulator
MDELLNSFVMELRRGAIIIAVLSRLSESQYGYLLVQTLAEEGLAVEPGTLYPLLRRLEKQGILTSNWDTSESRPRKYYRLSADGEKLYARLLDEWGLLSDSMNNLVGRSRRFEGND